MAKKTTTKTKSKSKLPKVPKQNPGAIFNFWLAAAKETVGPKRFAARAVTNVGLKLRKSIGKRLKRGPFTAADARNTRQLARMLGRLCRISSAEQTVRLDTVQQVFAVVKNHPRCPGGGGQGAWCSIT
jgi:hypothetical protein